MFAIRNLSVLAYTNGFTLWHYKAGRTTIEETMKPGFFMAASDMTGIGDIIMITASDGATIVTVTHSDPAQHCVARLS